MDYRLPVPRKRLIVGEQRRHDMKRRLMWFLLAVAVIVVGGVYARILLATPSSGFTGTTLAVARFDEIDLNTHRDGHDHHAQGDADDHVESANAWRARLETEGLSDLYVQSNVWTPGGTTGWHTHPGPSLIIVTAGTVTGYEADDPSCTPHLYSQGMGFIDPGGGHVHVLRNETSSEARTIAVQLIPAAAVRRIDAASPGNCPF
jgi:quercetin dioxygenase-like cupin family protein